MSSLSTDLETLSLYATDRSSFARFLSLFAEADGTVDVHDQTGANKVNLQRSIYLTIMSALDFEEATHKLLKIDLGPGQEVSLASFLLSSPTWQVTDSLISTATLVRDGRAMLFARAHILEILWFDG